MRPHNPWESDTACFVGAIDLRRKWITASALIDHRDLGIGQVLDSIISSSEENFWDSGVYRGFISEHN